MKKEEKDEKEDKNPRVKQKELTGQTWSKSRGAQNKRMGVRKKRRKEEKKEEKEKKKRNWFGL
jgi:hypothetical protein